MKKQITQEEIQKIISEKGLHPLGNKLRLTKTDDQYNTWLLLFLDKDDAERYYNYFISHSLENPPPNAFEIMIVNIHTIYDKPYGIVMPYEQTEIRSEFKEWLAGTTQECNEKLMNYQPTDFSYEMLNKYVRELYKWTIIVPAGFGVETEEAKEILSDHPQNGYIFSHVINT